jgi:hypothetical protein
MSLWKTLSDVWDKMVVNEWLTRTWSWWTMHRRRASRSLTVEEPDVMEKSKWMFNPRNQVNYEESHITKCQSLLNQDIKWLGDQKWKLIILYEVLQVTTSKSQCWSKIKCGNPHEVKKKWSDKNNFVQAQVIEMYFIFDLEYKYAALSRGISHGLSAKSQYLT